MSKSFPKIILLDKPAIPTAYGVANSPIGYFLAAWQEELLTRLTLLPAHADKDLQALMEDYNLPAGIKQNNVRAKELVTTQLFEKNNWHGKPANDLEIGFHGTEFQYKAMQGMLKVPSGKTISYAALANSSGAPNASRAAGSVCAKNPVPFIVPCHRILTSDGKIGNYGFGTALKRQLLDWENYKLV